MALLGRDELGGAVGVLAGLDLHRQRRERGEGRAPATPTTVTSQLAIQHNTTVVCHGYTMPRAYNGLITCQLVILEHHHVMTHTTARPSLLHE